MNKIEVYKSHFTGEFFEFYDDYIKHIKEQEVKYEKYKKQDAQNMEFEKLYNEPRLLAESPEDFVSRIKFFIGERIPKDDELVYFAIDRMNIEKYSDNEIKGWLANIIIGLKFGSFKTKSPFELFYNFPGVKVSIGNYFGRTYKGIEGYFMRYSVFLDINDFPKILEKSHRFYELNKSKIKNSNLKIKRVEDLLNKDEYRIESLKKIDNLRTEIWKLQNTINSLNLELDEHSKELTTKIESELKFEYEEELKHLENIFK